MAKTHEQMRFQNLYEKVKRMRYNQEAFFRAQKGSPMRQGHLEESRKLEQEVDGLIKIMEFERIVDVK